MADLALRQRSFAARASEIKQAQLASRSDLIGAQQRVLAEIVAENAVTEFGRTHGFANIRSIDDYRSAVPIRDYDAFAPWCERMTRGEANVLTAAPPVVFRRTSGTTGAAKYIPVTARSLAVDHAKIALALAMPIERYPDVVTNPDAVWIVGHKTSTGTGAVTPSGVPWMSYSEHNQLGSPLLDGTPGMGARFHASTRPTSFAEAIYARLRFAVEVELRGIMAINPSTLVGLGPRLADSWERIVEELRAGTVLGEPKLPPNPRRADELAELHRAGRVRPRDVWPSLSYVQCWKSASCALYLPNVRELFGDVELLPFPYLASEGIASMQLDDHPTAGYLLPFGVLCEMLPVGGDATRLLHELERGQTYELVHTAFNGLYRYRMGDLFEVDSFDDLGVPRLEFAGRAGMYSSFTGEKLTEKHVARAVEVAAQALGITVRQFTCFPRWDAPPYYLFALESTAGDPAALARALDGALGEVNDEYPGKRSSGRLAPAQVELLPAGTFARLREQLIAGGANTVQLKDLVLQRDDSMLAALRSAIR